MNKKPPVFLIGMPRSGTSLIRACLSKHSQIAIPPKGELHFFGSWFNNDKYGDISEPKNLETFAHKFFANSNFPHLGISSDNVLNRFKASSLSRTSFFSSVMEEYAHKHKKARWGEKSTTHIEHLTTILQHYPNAKYVLIVRDPRDTYLSYKNYNNWQQKKKLPKKWRLKTKQWALTWHNNYLNALRIFLNNQDKFYLYRHEFLIGNPETELKKLLNFLEEPFESECLNISDVKWEQNSSFGDKFSVINSNSVGRWQEQISINALTDIEGICGDLMLMFGYEQSQNITHKYSLPISQRIMTIWN
jgi:hypothetical protein